MIWREQQGPDRQKWRGLLAAVFVAVVVCGPAQAQLTQTDRPESPQVASAWKTLLESDLEYLATLLRQKYIYAVFPDPVAFAKQLEDSLHRARSEVSLVDDFESYQAVLTHFIVSFGDAHFSAYYSVLSQSARWPGFTAVYRGGQVEVGQSTIAEVHPGDVIESCDGRNTNAWLDQLAEFYGGPVGRETTRAAVAARILVDRGNPLYALPSQCRIGANDVTLAWQNAPPNAIPGEVARSSGAATTVQDQSVSLTEFGDNGAWIRMGTMFAWNHEINAAFAALDDAAASLRNKDVVVIDVRGNAGGSYNWFMSFINAFYGREYADYHARARLQISNVQYAPAGESEDATKVFSGQAAEIKMPPDPRLEEPLESMTAEETTLADGSRLRIYPAPVEVLTFASEEPDNPVKARVYVLADYACGSACIGFVDEMMQFPGVTLVGAETHVDRRSGGWPGGYELPSGLAVVRMGRMERHKRARGDNEAWVPAEENRFPGDIADTEAVKSWLQETIIPRDAASRSVWQQQAELRGPEGR